MYRTHTCGELRTNHIGEKVTLAGWVQKVRNLGAVTFIDIRDRYGITQLRVDGNSDETTREETGKLGREFVIRAAGTVVERTSKNMKILTGGIEIEVERLEILNASEIPPFTIEDFTDGGDELRMRYRYLDLRREPLKKALMLRHKMAHEVRNYLDGEGFLEIETPYLIKSTPEGARDFVVPSRMNPGEFYALPQSPQTFKQLLMVAGYDRYFQIVRCFRDEDLRADRQPEFTQIDCEMSFADREDVLQVFEGLAKRLFSRILQREFDRPFPRMTYSDATELYGSDKPDIRFGMTISDLTSMVRGNGFAVFDTAEYIGGICVEDAASYTRKQLDELTEFVKRPQIGSKGMVYIKCEPDGAYKSSVDKFYGQDDLKAIAAKMQAKPGDLILMLSGTKKQSLSALSELRLEMGDRLGLRDPSFFSPLWVVDFPLLEWDESSGRYFAMHHPFTSPVKEDMEAFFGSNLGKVRANAYDFVINGVEVGGGSVRIYDSEVQERMFDVLGFSRKEAAAQFGFLMNAFKYGAPPHAGIAFGFDRWCAVFGGAESIRDYIAFPKNNSGRDTMIDSPSVISDEQLKELSLSVVE